MTKPTSDPQPLTDFMRDKMRKSCAVCQLSDDIRKQLGAFASKRKFTRDDQLEWLRNAVGARDVTMDALVAHLNGRHDQFTDGDA